MKKEQIQLILVIVLVIVLVLIWRNYLQVGRKVAAPKVVEEIPVLEEVKVPEAIPPPMYTGTGKPDPFQIPPGVKARLGVAGIKPKPLAQLNLQGIIWGEIVPKAIINNKVVEEGDEIDGVTIVEITKGGVRVLSAETEYFLTIR